MPGQSSYRGVDRALTIVFVSNNEHGPSTARIAHCLQPLGVLETGGISRLYAPAPLVAHALSQPDVAILPTFNVRRHSLKISRSNYEQILRCRRCDPDRRISRISPLEIDLLVGICGDCVTAVY